jgi:hypothetical protein
MITRQSFADWYCPLFDRGHFLIRFVCYSSISYLLLLFLYKHYNPYRTDIETPSVNGMSSLTNVSDSSGVVHAYHIDPPKDESSTDKSVKVEDIEEDSDPIEDYNFFEDTDLEE